MRHRPGQCPLCTANYQGPAGNPPCGGCLALLEFWTTRRPVRKDPTPFVERDVKAQIGGCGYAFKLSRGFGILSGGTI